jgi:hypothetical protein
MGRLPLDCLNLIAANGIPLYRALLALPRFARASIAERWQQYWQDHFTVCIQNADTSSLPVHIQNCMKIEFGSNRYGEMERDDAFRAIVYKLNGVYHRRGGPAIKLTTDFVNRSRQTNRNISSASTIIKDRCTIASEWLVHGQRHRIGGPAVRLYTISVGSNGKIFSYVRRMICRGWYVNGMGLHEIHDAYH